MENSTNNKTIKGITTTKNKIKENKILKPHNHPVRINSWPILLINISGHLMRIRKHQDNKKGWSRALPYKGIPFPYMENLKAVFSKNYT